MGEILTKLDSGDIVALGGMLLGAVAIIGGMISSTLLSLIVVPTMYSYFDDLQTGIKRLFSWRPLRRRAPAAPSERPAARPSLQPSNEPSNAD